jgi:hypothetical protein
MDRIVDSGANVVQQIEPVNPMPFIISFFILSFLFFSGYIYSTFKYWVRGINVTVKEGETIRKEKTRLPLFIGLGIVLAIPYFTTKSAYKGAIYSKNWKIAGKSYAVGSVGGLGVRGFRNASGAY